MGLELCKSCGRMHYSTEPCKESTAARMDVQGSANHRVRPTSRVEDPRPDEAMVAEGVGSSRFESGGQADTQVLPVDTNPLPHEDGGLYSLANPYAHALEGDLTIPSAPAANSIPKPKRDRNSYHAKYQREVYRPRVKARKALTVNQTNTVNVVVNDG